MPKTFTTEEIITELELVSVQAGNLATGLRYTHLELFPPPLIPPPLAPWDETRVERIVCRLETAADILRGILTCNPVSS